ncbi:helix-turn-helix domain-containing protein [Vitiosangium sp. GDMCC 1.1324]|uniref:helix-turn-helix domain-containing protein n=1 Tax=Vitiosangium sp. (strain GDMCC 1.1324) TaxID=2138576 RepID=UPI000D3A6016|nr:helix-turn-helix domain-containing protein [Vitiosangium sp. GDMCC 1.1324]PTL82493.1 hypothetical protein DAT35_16915 [Vitiosangium sp. GDMCC 1.1324]
MEAGWLPGVPANSPVFSEEFCRVTSARDTGFEPVAFGSGGQPANLPVVISPSQTLVTPRDSEAGQFQPSHPVTGSTKPFAAYLLQGAAVASGTAGARLLSVRDVADQLAVSTATVYALCKRRQLRHVRISGALRIDPASVEAFIAAGGASSGHG